MLGSHCHRQEPLHPFVASSQSVYLGEMALQRWNTEAKRKKEIKENVAV